MDAPIENGTAPQPLDACDGPGAAAARRAGQDLDRLVGLWQALRGALTTIERGIKSTSGEEALGLAHWLLLLRLGRHSPLPQSELRQQTHLDSGFLTRVLDELDARQLVRRTRSRADRRQVLLEITAPGRDAVRAMLTAAGASGRLALRKRDAERLQQLAATLFLPSLSSREPAL